MSEGQADARSATDSIIGTVLRTTHSIFWPNLDCRLRGKAASALRAHRGRASGKAGQLDALQDRRWTWTLNHGFIWRLTTLGMADEAQRDAKCWGSEEAIVGLMRAKR